MKITFDIDSNTEMICRWSVWTGLETYFINGKEVYRTRSFRLTLFREIEFQQNNVTKVITIQTLFKPTISTIFRSRGYIIQASVGGDILIPDLLDKKYLKKKVPNFPEIMIVIAIVGILAAIIKPATSTSYIVKSTIFESIVMSRPVQKQVEAFYFQNKYFPQSQKKIDKIPLSELNMRNVKAIDVIQDGRILITYDTSHIHFPSDITDETLILVPKFENGIVIWNQCIEGSIDSKYRSSECKNK